MFSDTDLSRITAAVKYYETLPLNKLQREFIYKPATSHLLVGVASGGLPANDSGTVNEYAKDDLTGTWTATGDTYTVDNIFSLPVASGAMCIFGKVGTAWVVISVSC